MLGLDLHPFDLAIPIAGARPHVTESSEYTAMDVPTRPKGSKGSTRDTDTRRCRDHVGWRVRKPNEACEKRGTLFPYLVKALPVTRCPSGQTGRFATTFLAKHRMGFKP